MKVREIMTKDVKLLTPEQSIRDAAQTMQREDVGLLPLSENDRLVGMITDRDIAVRAVAQGRGPDTKLREVMTADVKYCFEDEEVEQLAENMADIQMRRMPVLNRDKRLVGIVSLADFATKEAMLDAANALSGIAQPRH